jgi:hypothetical protein
MPRAACLVVLSGALSLLAACNGGESPAPPATNPPSTGATCDDPTGDLSRVASERGGNLGEPAGVDLTHAEARVTETGLNVSFTTAGPILSAPNPELRLAHGQTGQLTSFELVASPPDAGPGPWDLRLVTFRLDGRGGVTEAPRTVLNVPVTVQGDELAYEVPLRNLPAVSSYVWQFGASSTLDLAAGDTIIDDCDPSAGAPATATTAPAR